MALRGIRGAVRARSDTARSVLGVTRRLLTALVQGNDLKAADITAAFFTCTPDLKSAFPAEAARALGWNHVPMICTTEMNVPGALPRVVRVLLLAETPLAPGEIRHQYLSEARKLRPDLERPDRPKRRGGRR